MHANDFHDPPLTDNDCAAVHPRGQPAGLPQVADDARPGRVLLETRRAPGGELLAGFVG